jgi:N-acetylated-alpha-linked acidic dipeptidase
LAEDQVAQALYDAVDRERLHAHLTMFSRWMKEAGTPGELESLAYVQTVLDGYGYRTNRILHDAYISLPEDAWIEVGGERFDCITHSFSQPSPEGGTRAGAIVLGSGSDNDFAAADATGRIVIVDGIATPPVAQRAGRAGAVAQIHVSPHEHRHEMCISPVWGSPTHVTVAQLPRTVVVSVTKSVGEKLKTLCAETPDLEFALHAKVDTGWRKTPILVAELDALGAGERDPFVMFTGHHDTWYHGVMDNGGANATMIEVARLCALHREQWRRGLRIIFWSGHSQGRYSSSTWYADTHWRELHDRAIAHVNIDSTGAKGNVVLHDAQADAELVSLAREAIHLHGGQDNAGQRVARAGDQSFWGIGVPSIFAALGEQPASDAPIAAAMLFGGPGRKGAGTGWWWHTPDDTLDKMDLDIAVRDTQIYLHVVWALLTRLVLPFDYAAHVDAFLRKIDQDRTLVGDRFDLTSLAEEATLLKAEIEALNRIAASDLTEAQAEEVNRTLMALSRALVPIEHTLGDRFDHDPATAIPSYAMLQPLQLLAASEPGSDTEKFVTVALMRARNRIGHALHEARQAARRSLAVLPAENNVKASHAP